MIKSIFFFLVFCFLLSVPVLITWLDTSPQVWSSARDYLAAKSEYQSFDGSSLIRQSSQRI